MDLEIKIKEEPAWLEETTAASLENIEQVSEVIALKEEVKSELTEPGSMEENSLEESIHPVSGVIALKEEIKSELTEPGSMQENSLEPSDDITEEIFTEEHTDDQLLLYVKEETILRPEVSNADHQPPDGGAPCSGCNVCGKVPAGKLTLLQHLMRHKDDRPFKCDHCGKVYGSGSSMSELRNRPLLVCEFCHKDHLGIQTAEKPYCCNVCGKSFSQRIHLAQHMRTGTGEKPYCCNFCGRSFRQKIRFANHLRSHIGAKPYCCNVCGKSFRGNSNRAWHMPACHMRTRTGD